MRKYAQPYFRLPFNIKQATDGLNKLISMLYDVAAPSSSMSSDIGNSKKTSDHVRVMAMGLIKGCMKEKIEILTSQAAVTHALSTFYELASLPIPSFFCSCSFIKVLSCCSENAPASPGIILVTIGNNSTNLEASKGVSLSDDMSMPAALL
jgi:hypothetical protein